MLSSQTDWYKRKQISVKKTSSIGDKKYAFVTLTTANVAVEL